MQYAFYPGFRTLQLGFPKIQTLNHEQPNLRLRSADEISMKKDPQQHIANFECNTIELITGQINPPAGSDSDYCCSLHKRDKSMSEES